MNAPPACTSLRGPVRGRGNPFLRCLPCKGRCRATRGGGVNAGSCSQDGSCADQDPFLFSILREKRNGSWTPKRKGRPRDGPGYRDQAGHRDRQTFSLVRSQSWDCGPPLPGAEEGGTESPQPRFLRAVAKQARKKQMRQGGIVCRRCFRAEPLRLALPWVQDEAGCFAPFFLLHVIASQ